MAIDGMSLTQNLLFEIDVDLLDAEKIDVAREKIDGLRMASERATRGMNMFTDANRDAEKSGGDAEQTFGKMFGIGMNLLFAGMALNMVFGRLARSMLEMTGASKALATSIKVALLPFFIEITPLVLELSQAIMDLPRSIKMVLGAATALLAVLGPIMMIAGQIITFIAPLSVSLTGLASAAGPVILVLGALVAVAGALAEVFGEFPGLFKTVKNAIIFSMNAWVKNGIKVINGFKNILAGLLQFLLGVFTLQFDEAFEGLKDIGTGLLQFFDGIFGELDDLLLSAAKSAFDRAMMLGKNIIRGTERGIRALGNLITDAFLSVLPPPIAGAVKGLSAFAPDLSGAIRDTISVNDFILTGDGKMIQPAANDTIVGFNGNGPIQPGGGGGEVTVNINDPVMKEDVDVERVVDEVEERVDRDTRGRSGGIGV